MADEQITILIPTCQRAGVLPYSLATCLAQDDRNCTILVSDNASEDETPDVIARAAAKDPRVRSIRVARRLGMAEHWEYALSHIKDGWVVIIGDDDGLLPRALPNLRQAAARHPDIEAISWPYSFYIYPDPAKSVRESGLLALGQAADEQTVCKRRSASRARSSEVLPLPGACTRNHGGFGVFADCETDGSGTSTPTMGRLAMAGGVGAAASSGNR
jgi:glycosyltransferase involved in cell wall biosynthesis